MGGLTVSDETYRAILARLDAMAGDLASMSARLEALEAKGASA